MKRNDKRNLILAGIFLVLFGLLTLALARVDVRAVGPGGSEVGFASLNQRWAEQVGVRWALYELTDWLGLAVLGVAFGFAVLGLVQAIRRRSLRRVDPAILILGAFYLMVFGFYALFEFWVINHRPVLIDGILEPSYPSSTTLLSLCVLGTAIPLWLRLVANPVLRRGAVILSTAVLLFALAGRLLSGVHWLTDILGGVLLSGFLVMGYLTALGTVERRDMRCR